MRNMYCAAVRPFLISILMGMVKFSTYIVPLELYLIHDARLLRAMLEVQANLSTSLRVNVWETQSNSPPELLSRLIWEPYSSVGQNGKEAHRYVVGCMHVAHGKVYAVLKNTHTHIGALCIYISSRPLLWHTRKTDLTGRFSHKELFSECSDCRQWWCFACDISPFKPLWLDGVFVWCVKILKRTDPNSDDN